MTEFFRFPHTPHLAWLGHGKPRDDKVMSPSGAREFLSHEIVVEEKVDGANLGLSVTESGELRAQNRGAYLSRRSSASQFKPLFHWLDARQDALSDALFPNLILFGEWCWAIHSVRYTKLPDWFLAFDVYDRSRGEFWSARRRDELVSKLRIALVPQLGSARYSIAELRGMLGDSKLTNGPAEGLYVRRDEGGHLVARAKLVRPEFVQAIGDHWSRRTIETNQLAGGAAWR
jgi:ATP-dependent RNA circularization protein (DNA/RNA ligase family)